VCVTIILSVVLYGCTTWSFISREKYRLLRKIFGPNMAEVTGKWRRLHNEQLYDCAPHKMLLGRSNQEE
jgi:hypothetical protein